MRHPQLRGVLAATPTPVLPDYSPDVPQLVLHLRQLLESGCDGINLLGTTGEANSFSLRARLSLMNAVKDAGLPMNRMMVGTGVCSLEETVALTQAAADLGFAGALILPPFFYPDIQGSALLDYIDAVVERIEPHHTSLYLYHIPQNTGVPWPVEVVAQLARKHEGLLRGIKDSSGDISYSRAIAAANRDFAVFPSSEGTLFEASTNGFAGCISATTNVTAADSQYAWMHQGSDAAKEASDRAMAIRAVLARQALVASVKAALGLFYDEPHWMLTCPPLVARSAGEAEILRGELRAAGLSL